MYEKCRGIQRFGVRWCHASDPPTGEKHLSNRALILPASNAEQRTTSSHLLVVSYIGKHFTTGGIKIDKEGKKSKQMQYVGGEIVSSMPLSKCWGEKRSFLHDPDGYLGA